MTKDRTFEPVLSRLEVLMHPKMPARRNEAPRNPIADSAFTNPSPFCCCLSASKGGNYIVSRSQNSHL
jgi:hypothetical protein